MFTKPQIIEGILYCKSTMKYEDKLKGRYGEALTIIDPLIKSKGDACYIINEGERVVLIFPGSNDVIDWILNFYKYDKPVDGIHPGIKLGIELLAEKIIAKLLELKPNTLCIYGFSRGAALADAYLELYGDAIPCEIDCITYAQPKLFTQAFYDKIPSMKDRSNVYFLRVEMANDVVTKIPFKKYGYRFKGNYLTLGKKIPWYKQLRMFWLRLKNNKEFFLAGISEHDLDVYLDEMK